MTLQAQVGRRLLGYRDVVFTFLLLRAWMGDGAWLPWVVGTLGTVGWLILFIAWALGREVESES